MNSKLVTVGGLASISGAAFGLGSAIPRLIELAIGNFYYSTEILIFLVAVAGVASIAGMAFGLGLTIPLATKWALRNFSSKYILIEEMLNLIISKKDNKVTFDQFPYYVCEQIKVKLRNAAFLQLAEADLSRHTRNLSPASQTILLSGPSELYLQTLAKALANSFHSDLLLLDVFSYKIRSKCGAASKRSNSEATLPVSGSSAILSREEENATAALSTLSSGADIASMGTKASSCSPKLNASASCDNNLSSHIKSSSSAVMIKPTTTSWVLNDKLLIKALYKVLSKASKGRPLILYLRDVEKFFCISERTHILFQKMLKKLKGPVLILGSRIVHTENNKDQVSEQLASVFSYKIEVRPPEDETRLVRWKTQLEEDMKTIQHEDIKDYLFEVLASNDIECDDLGSLRVTDTIAVSNNIEEIVVSAISSHLMNNKNPEYRNGKLLIPARSLGDTKKVDTKKDDPKKDGGKTQGDNEFEKRIRLEVIPANKINVTFHDIGALDDVKESLQELVILPVRRPDLFEGGILKPCKGLLLFGPPGTGKTMLAKAIAKEAGASFINITASVLQSKWLGESEKLVKALFSVAAKVSPTIIFIDEVDSLLSARSSGEHDSYRKFKNEFMLCWDGLLTDADQKILVLGATNRPFDLDDAVIRRFQRRIMVGIPMAKSRETIFRTLLEKQKRVDAGIDFKELATMTEGYSGSDLKNLCAAAALRPVREFIQKEKLIRDLEKKKSGDKSSEISKKEDKGKAICSKVSDEATDKADSSKVAEEAKKETITDIRPLNMEDFKEAKKQIGGSFCSGGFEMEKLKRWNRLYAGGDGESKPEILTYFL